MMHGVRFTVNCASIYKKQIIQKMERNAPTIREQHTHQTISSLPNKKHTGSVLVLLYQPLSVWPSENSNTIRPDITLQPLPAPNSHWPADWRVAWTRGPACSRERRWPAGRCTRPRWCRRRPCHVGRPCSWPVLSVPVQPTCGRERMEWRSGDAWAKHGGAHRWGSIETMRRSGIQEAVRLKDIFGTDGTV